MRQSFDLAALDNIMTQRTTHRDTIWLECLQLLQDAYEDWLIASGRCVGIVDMWWSWDLQC